MAVNTLETSTVIDMSKVSHLAISRTVPGIMQKLLSGPVVLKNVLFTSGGVRMPYITVQQCYDSTSTTPAYTGGAWVGTKYYTLTGDTNTILATAAYDLANFAEKT